MLSLPSGPHGARPASRKTDSAQRCDVHAVVAAVRLRRSSMVLSTPAAPRGGQLLRWCSRHALLAMPRVLLRSAAEVRRDLLYTRCTMCIRLSRRCYR